MTNKKNSNGPNSTNPRSEAIRALWDEFEPWLKGHQEASQAELTRFLDRSPMLPERMNEVRDVFRQEHLKSVRRAWIERLNRRGLSVYDWDMTNEEKEMVRNALEWTPGGKADEKEDKDTGNEAKGKGKQNRQHHQNQNKKQNNQRQNQNNQKKQQKKQPNHEEEPQQEEDDLPLAGDLFGEEEGDAKEANENDQKSNQKQKQTQSKQNQNKQNHQSRQKESKGEDTSRPILSPEAYTIPLNYAAPQFGDPDYELLEALGMTGFAVSVVEAKIREFYAEACEATLLFNRNISVLSRGPALQRVQEHFDDRMKGLAMQKRQEWKELINAELVRKVIQADSGKKAKILSKWRPKPDDHIDQATADLLHRGAIKRMAPRAHGRSASFSDTLLKPEADHDRHHPSRVKNFIEKVVKQVKFSSSAESDDSERLPDMPPLIYRPHSMW